MYVGYIRGKTGIRTLGTRKGTTVFETVPIDHSGIFPRWLMGIGALWLPNAVTKVRKFFGMTQFFGGYFFVTLRLSA